MLNKVFLIGAAGFSAVLLVISLPLLIFVGVLFKGASAAQADTCTGSNVVLVNPQLSSEQLRIAGIIIATAAQLSHKANLSLADTAKAELIGVAVGYGESSLTNVLHGDVAGPDSIGVFQQRTGWGPLSARTDPAQATTLFFTDNKGPGVEGLFHTPGWQQMSLTDAAHSVQHNADPSYYAQFQGLATRLVTQANGANQSANLSLTGCTAAGTANGTLTWPVPLKGSAVSSCYGPRVLNGVAGFHPGVDISQPIGTPVFAAASGKVSFAGPVSGYGNNYVTILHGGHIVTGYGHMNAMLVTLGQSVTKGQQIGVVGNQGASFGAHLHFNVIDITKPHDIFNGNVDPLKNGLAIPTGVPNPNGCS